MRFSEERQQWEHTKEEEAAHGFELTNSIDMPPSLRREIHELYVARAALVATPNPPKPAGAALDEALRHLRKWHSPGVCALAREHACGTCDFIEAAAASPKEAP